MRARTQGYSFHSLLGRTHTAAPTPTTTANSSSKVSGVGAQPSWRRAVIPDLASTPPPPQMMPPQPPPPMPPHTIPTGPLPLLPTIATLPLLPLQAPLLLPAPALLPLPRASASTEPPPLPFASPSRSKKPGKGSKGTGKDSRDGRSTTNRATFVHEARADAADEADAAARKQHEDMRQRERLRMRADQAMVEELARVQEEEQRHKTREFLAKAKEELSRHAEDEEELMPWEISANRLAEEDKLRRAAAERAAAEQRAREERAAAAAAKATAERAQRHAELEAEKEARLEAERDEASSRARLKADKEKAAAARAAERAAAEMAAQEKAAADRAAARKVREANKESRAAAKATRAAERVEVEAEGAHDGAHDSQLTETHSRPPKRPRTVSKVLPHGWREQLHHANSRTYPTFHGPNGEKARSIAEAIRLHNAAGGSGGGGGGGCGSGSSSESSESSDGEDDDGEAEDEEKDGVDAEVVATEQVDPADSSDEELLEKGTVRRENQPTAAPAPKLPKRPRTVSKVLPHGWREKVHHANSRTYPTFHGPNGEKARSIAEAMRLHNAAGGSGGGGGSSFGGGVVLGGGVALGGGVVLGDGASPTSEGAVMDREVQAAAVGRSSSSAVEHAADTLTMAHVHHGAEEHAVDGESSDNGDIPLNAKKRKLSKPFSPRKPELASASDWVPPSDSSDDELREKDTLLQKRISVWWTGSKQWFSGHVVDVRWDKGKPAHRIKYEAGGVSQWHHLLGNEPVKWKELPDELSSWRSTSGVQALD